METVHLLIRGKVQGVFFRQTAARIAHSLHITGWIKNTKDARVEAIITGNNEDIKKFIAWCQAGPDKAKVENVAISKQPDATFKNFEVIRER
ncbi:MAG: acylphosphatase [Ginsengibacter sp.]